MRTSFYRYECSKCGQLFLVVVTDNKETDKCLPQEMRANMVKETGSKKLCAHCHHNGTLIGRESEIMALRFCGHTDEEIEKTKCFWLWLDNFRASETRDEAFLAKVAKDSAP
jgi:hypothetical protein